MKGIFITERGKQELEAKLAVLEIKLENHVQHCKITGGNYDYSFEQALEFHKEILSSATVLPVEESWDAVQVSAKPLWQYVNGVIIQPKQ